MLNSLFSSLWFWLALLVVAMMALRIVVRQIRWSYERGSVGKLDLDLADLQRLVAKGLMTQEEYLKAREVILSRTDARFEPAKGFPVLGPMDQGKTPSKTQ
ncbi:MAG TPA: SHOCT domain-containing protein [Tepidisphaeraceae bacterium]|jgi:uncharacterized membrane protein|nr:SHOCT domain-containing protein [Tepidisphaeraceae bacterium]